MILGGFVLLLGGYFTSNLFLISDLYHVGMGPGGRAIPSPLAAAFTTAPQQWGLYVACAAAFVAGTVMIGSQPFNPMAIVCYVMCPLVGMIYAIATPLRIVKKYAEPVSGMSPAGGKLPVPSPGRHSSFGCMARPMAASLPSRPPDDRGRAGVCGRLRTQVPGDGLAGKCEHYRRAHRGRRAG